MKKTDLPFNVPTLAVVVDDGRSRRLLIRNVRRADGLETIIEMPVGKPAALDGSNLADAKKRFDADANRISAELALRLLGGEV